jgi:hypothetical protein
MCVGPKDPASPLALKLADAARKNDITVVLGLSERDGGSPTSRSG